MILAIFKKNKIKIALFVGIFLFLAVNSNWNAFADENAEDIENKIDKTQEKLDVAQKELDASRNKLDKTNIQINTTKNLIVSAEEEIGRKEREVENLTNRINLEKKILANFIQEAYLDDQNEGLFISLNDYDFSASRRDFFQNLGVRDKIINSMEEIENSKMEIANTQKELSDKKDDHEKLLNLQQGQKVEINADIQEAQATVSELKGKIDKLRSELSNVLGSSVSYENIMDAAAYAAKVTKIRKDYLLGVLVVESNLGRFTGGCNFKESRMSGERASIFKDICKELDYNYQKMKVSCPPKGYKGTGGAMGVAQFMPDTWIGYKKSIASVTGHNPPDPWDLTDGVIAMALKLTKVDGVTAHKKSSEAKAYCIYLAGGNWQSYCDSKGVNYGEKVLYWADNYEKMLK